MIAVEQPLIQKERKKEKKIFCTLLELILAQEHKYQSDEIWLLQFHGDNNF